MDFTYQRLAKVLGATAVEGSGPNARFMVHGPAGGLLKVSVEGNEQRVMAVLTDAAGVTRCTLDVAPVTHATEDAAFPGRVTLHVGNLLIRLDSQPSLAVEVTTP
jgi:hypothetical protein